jgi:hypothetical protein
MTIEEAIELSAKAHNGTPDESVAQSLAEMFPKEIKDYTQSDFLDGSEPYDYLYLYHADKFAHDKLMAKMSNQAKSVKVNNFMSLYKAYLATREGADDNVGNVTDFPHQPLALKCGGWTCDAGGVRMPTERGIVCACPHPIMPVARMRNIDTGVEKVKLAFWRGKQWRQIIVDRKTISAVSKITDLADVGISVTSETAKSLVSYFYDVEQANPELLPEIECVTRLGWIDRGEGREFVPYVGGVVFDGEAEYKKRFDAVSTRGDFGKWLEFIKTNIRENPNIIARITFAASLASALVKPLYCNCFWLHLWGESESAKTVLMMCAASIWGNPTISYLITTFNSTYVGNEKGAAFSGSLPYFLDELQIVDSKKEMDALIYMLTEGSGRSRGNKQGGLDNVAYWKNCTISTGEKPINTGRSNGGAVNRVVECECKSKFFEAPRSVAAFVQENYGFFGKAFVAYLEKDGVMKHAEELLERYTDELTARKITQKQAQSAALILTADALAAEIAFDEETQLTVDEIAEFLKTKDEVSANPRAYEYICEQVASNQLHFIQSDRPIDLWGALGTHDDVYIIKSVFVRLCDEGGYNSASLLSWLNQKGYIERNCGKNTVPKRIGGVLTRCVHLAMNVSEEEEELPEL